MPVAAFIGRFQPFHLGHKQVIDQYREDYEIVIVVGSASESRTEENPLSFEERKELIHECYPGANIVPQRDYEKNDEGNQKWIEEVLEKTSADVIISRNELVKQIVEGREDVELLEQELEEPDMYSGTEIRRRIISGEEWRYLVPECAKEKLSGYLDRIKESGKDYEFDPGWEPENAYN
ncbi:MAG: adenylyltransferase/cytidyltransferase family protein [Candidatus Nanohaloarchaea archaeon]